MSVRVAIFVLALHAAAVSNAQSDTMAMMDSEHGYPDMATMTSRLMAASNGGMTLHDMGGTMMMMDSSMAMSMSSSMGMSMTMTGGSYPNCPRDDSTQLVDGTVLASSADGSAAEDDFSAQTAMSLITCVSQPPNCSSGDFYRDVDDITVNATGGITWGFDATTGETTFRFGDVEVGTGCSAGCDYTGVIAVVVDCDSDACAECKPGVLQFEFTGAKCGDTASMQEGKATCSDLSTSAAPLQGAQVTIETGSTKLTGSFADGIVTLAATGDKFDAQSELTVVVDGAPYQALGIHTSCSKQLNFGDEFGSLRLVGAECPPSGGGGGGGDGGICEDCGGRPGTLTFELTGGGCTVSNDQGGKSTCTLGSAGQADFVAGTAFEVAAGSGSDLTIVPAGDGKVNVSGVGGFEANTYLTVTQGTGSQDLLIHTSCSQDLLVGDVYGALTLTSFDCAGGGQAGMGSSMSSSSMASTGRRDDDTGICATCGGRPASLTFNVSGGYMPCGVSSNDQGDKFSCSDVAGAGGAGSLVISGPDVVAAAAGAGLISISSDGDRFGAETLLSVGQGSSGTVQELNVHTSCSVPLVVGDTYGSLELVSFTCDDNGGNLRDRKSTKASPARPEAYAVVESGRKTEASAKSLVRGGKCWVRFYRDGNMCTEHHLSDVVFPATADGVAGMVGSGFASTVIRNMDGYDRALSSDEVACLSEDQCAPKRCYMPTPSPLPTPPVVVPKDPNVTAMEASCSPDPEQVDVVCANEMTLATCVDASALSGLANTSTSLFVNGFVDDTCIAWRLYPSEGRFEFDVGEYDAGGRHTGRVTTAAAYAPTAIDAAYVVVRAKYVPPQVCKCHPEYIDFVYRGTTCDEAAIVGTGNTQNGKYECEQLTGGTPVNFVVDGISYPAVQGATIRVGEAGGRIDANTDFVVLGSGGEVIQRFTVHTSCSQPIGVGDVYGVVEVQAFSECGEGSKPRDFGDASGGAVVVDFFVDGEQIGETQRIPVDASDGKSALSTCPGDAGTVGDSDGVVMRGFGLWSEFLTDDQVEYLGNNSDCSCGPPPPPSPSPSPSPTPSNSASPSFAKMEVAIPGLNFGTGRATRGCISILSIAPYFRICEPCAGLGLLSCPNPVCGEHWRIPISELFIRSKDSRSKCLPPGEIAYDPAGNRMLPRLNTLQRYKPPTGVAAPESFTDGNSCISYLQPVRDASMTEPTITPVTGDGIPDVTRRSLLGMSPTDCIVTTKDAHNTPRINFIRTAANELNFEETGAFDPTNIPDSSGSYEGLNQDDVLFDEGTQEICPGDEVFQFAISSTGVRSVCEGSNCNRNMMIAHRVVLHVRQTFDPADDCASELCFNTTKFEHLTGTTAGPDGISCYDASEIDPSFFSPKWYPNPNDLPGGSSKYTLNGEHELLQGTDLVLLSNNQQTTGVCQRCDLEYLQDNSLDVSEHLFCPNTDCRVCDPLDLVGNPVAQYQTSAAISQTCDLLTIGPPYYLPNGKPSGCPASQTCPATLDPVAPLETSVIGVEITARDGECVTVGCFNQRPDDNITVRVSFLIQELIPQSDGTFLPQRNIDANDLDGLNFGAFKIYGDQGGPGQGCEPDALFAAFEDNKCTDTSHYVPSFSMDIAIVNDGDYPNLIGDVPALAGVIVCPDILYRQNKYLAWEDTGEDVTYTNPTTQRTKLVAFGQRSSPAITTLIDSSYVDIDGNAFAECGDGQSVRCPRVGNFNCPG